jgi:UDP-N-acetylmuramyl pentapeptide phosphotransferase/UDP-N-acetylglucosamine-1-phosphate transferase
MAERKQLTLPWQGGLAIVVGTALLALVFHNIDRPELTRPTGLSIIMIAFAVAIRWEFRRRAWFWVTMVLVAALHVPLILLVPWTAKWVPAVVAIPFCLADLYLMLAILSVVGKLVERPRISEG